VSASGAEAGVVGIVVGVGVASDGLTRVLALSIDGAFGDTAELFQGAHRLNPMVLTASTEAAAIHGMRRAAAAASSAGVMGAVDPRVAQEYS
jgi:hypothetical protein